MVSSFWEGHCFHLTLRLSCVVAGIHLDLVIFVWRVYFPSCWSYVLQYCCHWTTETVKLLLWFGCYSSHINLWYVENSTTVKQFLLLLKTQELILQDTQRSCPQFLSPTFSVFSNNFIFMKVNWMFSHLHSKSHWHSRALLSKLLVLNF